MLKVRACVSIRWAIARDLDQMLDLEYRSFGESAWTREDFLRAFLNARVAAHVAERESRVLGYLVYEWTATTIYLTSLAVHPGWRRKEIGTQLLERLLAQPSGRGVLVANVPESLGTAVLAGKFFASMGFSSELVRGEFGVDSWRFTKRLDSGRNMT